MKRTVLVAFEVDSHFHPNADNIDVDLTVAQRAVASDEDFADAVRVSLAMFFPTDDLDEPCRPTDLSVVVVDPDAACVLLQAAEVGLEGADRAELAGARLADEAWLAVQQLRGERVPDDDGAPCCPDPGCPGRSGGTCTFPGYAANH